MRKLMRITSLSALFLVAAASQSATARAADKGNLVIVFKDGHRQTINMSDIDRIEFPAGDAAGTANTNNPSRARFLGKWEVGDGGGNTFYISLYDDGGAKRSMGNVHGKWHYVNGEARITWDDGAQDAIRRAGGHFQKFAYHQGKSFTDEPDNVTPAKNTMGNPL